MEGRGDLLPMMSEMAFKKIAREEDVVLFVKDADISIDEYFRSYVTDSPTKSAPAQSGR
jgi:hypothetical protein